MLAVLLVSAVLLAAVCGLGWYGAGLMVRPPKMSKMEKFPEDFGVKGCETVSFAAADGARLAGWLLPSPTGEDKTVLVCHGWGDNKGEVLAETLFLHRLGWNLFYFDFRGHGESAPSLVTMGKLELRDFSAAMAFLKKERPAWTSRLCVFGQSMGAAIAVQALPDFPEVRAAVLESPYPNYHLVGGRWAWMNNRVPYFPIVAVLMLMIKLRTGHADADLYDPEDRIGAARLPLFFIAGEDDRLMLPSDVRALHDLAPGPKSFWLVPGAPHAKCHETAPEEYERRVAEFLNGALAPSSALTGN